MGPGSAALAGEEGADEGPDAAGGPGENRSASAPRRALGNLTATFDRLPIRTRLAGVSALLTFTILCAFAIAIGSLTVRRIRSDFNHEVETTAQQLPKQLSIRVNPATYKIESIVPPLQDLVTPPQSAVIRVLTLGGVTIEQAPSNAPNLGAPSDDPRTVAGYRVVSLPATIGIAGSGEPIGRVVIQYGRSVADTERDDRPRRAVPAARGVRRRRASRCSRGSRSPAARWRRSPS